MARPFQNIGGSRPPYSSHDLSYTHLTSCDMGQLIPIMWKEVVPGDRFSIGHEIVIRFQPLVAPKLHDITATVHCFYVPYRLLWDGWEDFITGGIDGKDDSSIPKVKNTIIPPTNLVSNQIPYSLWDYFGLPTVLQTGGGITIGDVLPNVWPWRAYNFIYNEYYRDENLIDEVDLDQPRVLLRAWKKDYFTSALPFQQRGVPPALPVSGTLNAIFDGLTMDSDSDISLNQQNLMMGVDYQNLTHVGHAQAVEDVGTRFKDWLGQNHIALSDKVITFDVSDLRLAFQVQKWLERNARAGVRYTEFLRAHFNVSPRDERLDRPEYIGGMKAPVIVSEVLQTDHSNSGITPQGNMAGHAISANSNFIGKYAVKEYGIIMSILSVMPRAIYNQGVDRALIRKTRYDHYFPEFLHLSEQPIMQKELYYKNESSSHHNDEIFGYQGRYDEMRVSQSCYTGDMRDLFSYWHLGRNFDNEPRLNQSFIECVPKKDIFAVQKSGSLPVHGLLVHIGNIIKAVRPITQVAEPGFIDH